MYKSSDKLFTRYKSPVLTEGHIGSSKEYERVRVTGNGSWTIYVGIAGAPVVAKQFNLGEQNSSVEMIGVKKEYMRGHNIRFRLEGIGEIHAIEYNVKDRENG